LFVIQINLLLRIYAFEYILFLFSFHLLVQHPRHLQKLLLGEDPFINKERGKGFLLGSLGHEEFVKGDDLFGIKADCHCEAS
jgi:hypothetical protein